MKKKNTLKRKNKNKEVPESSDNSASRESTQEEVLVMSPPSNPVSDWGEYLDKTIKSDKQLDSPSMSPSNPSQEAKKSALTGLTKGLRRKLMISFKKSEESKSRGTLIISNPRNSRHTVHVDFDFNWQPPEDEKGLAAVNPAEEFELAKMMGAGAFGAVYKAKHKSSGFVLAIKTINVPAVPHPKTESNVEKGDSMEWLKKMKREMDILKKCRYERIISYYGSIFTETQFWIIMELCVGSVQDIINYNVLHKRIIKEVDLAYITKCTLEGLAYLHKIDILHRDIKPGNILINHVGDIKLSDFGASREIKSTLTTLSGGGLQLTPNNALVTITGTPVFMAPELLDGRSHNNTSDLWSVGITAITIAENRVPFSDLSPFSIMFKISQFSDKNRPSVSDKGAWSKSMDDFIARCLVHDPAARPSAEALLKHQFFNIISETENYDFQTNLKEFLEYTLMKEQVNESKKEAEKQQQQKEFKGTGFTTEIKPLGAPGTGQSGLTTRIEPQSRGSNNKSHNDAGALSPRGMMALPLGNHTGLTTVLPPKRQNSRDKRLSLPVALTKTSLLAQKIIEESSQTAQLSTPKTKKKKTKKKKRTTTLTSPKSTSPASPLNKDKDTESGGTSTPQSGSDISNVVTLEDNEQDEVSNELRSRLTGMLEQKKQEGVGSALSKRRRDKEKADAKVEDYAKLVACSDSKVAFNRRHKSPDLYKSQ
eukprot:TRINITY_DN15359_c0_g1_i1.p1 TRINITY_DN15359_c0_g1~~TRINITY_DN15359_c0_g1_i1.p1  ORF type:complete len:709 (-),score=102.02 TRINITY_DN15359_c0_g1_i1:141-2267(-)